MVSYKWSKRSMVLSAARIRGRVSHPCWPGGCQKVGFAGWVRILYASCLVGRSDPTSRAGRGLHGRSQLAAFLKDKGAMA
jgi:hypothetical protein